ARAVAGDTRGRRGAAPRRLPLRLLAVDDPGADDRRDAASARLRRPGDAGDPLPAVARPGAERAARAADGGPHRLPDLRAPPGGRPARRRRYGGRRGARAGVVRRGAAPRVLRRATIVLELLAAASIGR